MFDGSMKDDMHSSRQYSIFNAWSALLLGATLCALSLPVAAQSGAKNASGVECPAFSKEHVQPLEGASLSAVYRSIDGHDLQLYIFDPPAHKSSDRAAVLVLFYGGGWSRGSPRQFETQAKYFARKGMVVVLADYRVRCRQGASVTEAISDAKAAVRWVRSHSVSLGIDPSRVAAGGGSAGGHLALSTAILDGEGEAATAGSVSSRPDALLLFSTPVDLTAGSIRSATGLDHDQSAELSPVNRLRRGLPPTLFLQGKDDHLVGIHTVEDYCAKARVLDNQCTVISFDAGHTFFNRNVQRGTNRSEDAKLRKKSNYYREALENADKFLATLGYVSRP